jgi:hypothetical protein
MEFIAREVVEGFLIGLHRSPHRGFSAVFSIRQGDELWRPLVAITLLLLESIIAASGATQASPSWTQRTGAAPTAPLSVS